MAGVAPLFARRHDDDLSWHDVPESSHPKCDRTRGPEDLTSRGPVFDREENEFDRVPEFEITRGDLVLPAGEDVFKSRAVGLSTADYRQDVTVQ